MVCIKLSCKLGCIHTVSMTSNGLMTDQTNTKLTLIPENSGLMQRLEQRWSMPGGVVNRPRFEPSSTIVASAFLQRSALIDRLQSRAAGQEDAGTSLDLTVSQPTTARENYRPSVLSETPAIEQTRSKSNGTRWPKDSPSFYRVRRMPAVQFSSQTPTPTQSSMMGELNTLQRTTDTNQIDAPIEKPQSLLNQTDPSPSVAHSTPSSSTMPAKGSVGSLQLQRLPTKPASTPYTSESENPFKVAVSTAMVTGIGSHPRQQVPMVLRQGHRTDNSSGSAPRHAERSGFDPPPPSSFGQRVELQRLPDIVSRSAISQPSSSAKGVVMPSALSYQTGIDTSAVSIGQLAEQVSRILSRRLAVERERRGVRR